MLYYEKKMKERDPEVDSAILHIAEINDKQNNDDIQYMGGAKAIIITPTRTITAESNNAIDSSSYNYYTSESCNILKNNKNNSNIKEPQQDVIGDDKEMNCCCCCFYDSRHNNHLNIPFEKWCFILGFLCPLVWFIGSSDCCGCRDSVGQDVLLWKKRCRIAATLALTIVIVTVAVVMIVNPSMFGLRSGNPGTQTSSSSDNAIRPGVPLNGTNVWGDTIAGVRPTFE
ncbi:hypothetical protein BDA99DRAFT_567321 [Phascolomyces articulosus]|uniref:Uncharacterized protein n=1 Tax=Phascolomyces articulosus TaxID=60185 RepID=A0AAD5KQP2_9FUNG|nr:hypothetical protein BDA99DRAFT_567321 [Phascolomyces articulosus]